MGKFGLGCLRLRSKTDEVSVLDYKHCSLDYIPSDVFAHERTLEELHVDSNQISQLPRELFYCHGLRKLVIADNELTKIPPAIGSLINLEELDFSKNGVVDLPDNIKLCKYLRTLDGSVNPLGKLPEGFTQLLQLSELYLNDAFLDFLPGSFGRLSKLKILEIRENHLKTLPNSISRFTQLERLDIGNNDFTELPEVVGSLTSLLELWCDSNQMKTMPSSLGGLKQLMFLDASKNCLEALPAEIEGCLALADLHLSTNQLHSLPESIGRLSNLTTLKIDDNRLASLPFSIGGLVSLSELNVGANDLEEIPPSIGLLRHLRTMYADENFLLSVPPELGSCSGLTVLSLRSNNLTAIPDELGRIPRLRVLNLSDNKIRFLPFSLTKLKELQALWLAENQTKPLIRLQSDIDIDTGRRMLTCYLLPQQPASDDNEDAQSEGGNSFHPSVWEEERERRTHIHFDFDEPEPQSRLERIPTPYPKEMKDRFTHMRNLALKQLELPNGDVRTGTGPVSTEPVAGRRSDPPEEDPVSPVTSGEPPNPSSPMTKERHHLYRADKEKSQKDKARMSQARLSGVSQSESGSGVNQGSEGGATASRGTTTEGAARSRDQDDGGFLTPGSKRRGPQGSQDPLMGGPPQGPDSVPVIHSLGPPPVQRVRAPPCLPLSSHPPGPPPRGPPPSQAGPPPPGPSSSAQDINVASHPATYHDFLRGLANKGVVVPKWPGNHRHGNQHRSNGSSRSHGNGHKRGQGYESETGVGYRSDTGRRSEAGYRSDTGHRSEAGYRSDTGHRSEAGYRSDTGHRSDTGYRSDTGQYRPSGGRRGGGLTVRDGYSSDRDSLLRAQRGRSQPGRGYSSDSGRGRSPAMLPPPLNQPSPYSQLNNSHKYPNHRPLVAGYSNVPTTRRITIRPDEMYPSNQQGNAPGNQPNPGFHPSNQPKPGYQPGNQPGNQPTPGYQPGNQPGPGYQHRNKLNPGYQPNKPGNPPGYQPSNQPGNQPGNPGNDPVHSVHSRRGSQGSDQQSVSSHSVRESIQEEGECGSDDDGYRAQLLKASVKLQKSPSEKSYRLSGSISEDKAASLERQVESSQGQGLGGQSALGEPPSYRPLPPYSPPKPRRQLLVTPDNQDPHSGLDSPRSVASHRSHRSSRSLERQSESDSLRRRHLDFDPARGHDPSVEVTPQRPATLPLRSSMTDPRPRRPPSHDLGSHDPRFRDLSLAAMSHPDLPTVTQGAVISGTLSNPNLAWQHSPRAATGGQTDGRTGWAPTSQYDTDVAVYKQETEPPSQVSSSTDSGYGQGHAFDSLRNNVLSPSGSSMKSPGGAPGMYKASPYHPTGPPSGPRGEGGLLLKAIPERASSLLRDQSGLACSTADQAGLKRSGVFRVTICKNPGLGFSIAGGSGSPGNPFRPEDMGIFITKVQTDGPAATSLLTGDKLLQVNNVDFRSVEHNRAVEVLRSSQSTVSLLVERIATSSC